MIRHNLSVIHKKIRAAAVKAGRDPGRVRLIAVSKNRSEADIRVALSAGQHLFGENRIQEAVEKIPKIPQTVEWHLIGHLQSNKAKSAVRYFEVIHSLDSIKLAHELDKQASRISKIQPVLIQVNLAQEDSKHGISESLAPDLIQKVVSLPNLTLLGLMTIPPFYQDTEKSRPFFRRLREMAFEEIVGKNYSNEASVEISMGMSIDYEVAIEEGATMVRIGTALFGPGSP